MTTPTTLLRHYDLALHPDAGRVIGRPFGPATEPRDLNPTDRARAQHVIERVLALDPGEAAELLERTTGGFEDRHRGLTAIFDARAAEMEATFAPHGRFSAAQRRLLGAYFLQEYSFESIALFNPSVVADPDQGGVPPGGRRFILSLRAVGEGHVSSLTFRAGMLEPDGRITIEPAPRVAAVPRERGRGARSDGQVVDLSFDRGFPIAERVIYPVTASQTNGIEDARFVEFIDDDGARMFYATYTAYTGHTIRSEMLATPDFVTFRMVPLRGSAARNKGMALFPRRFGGRYAMIGRQDNENLYLLYSDDMLTWDGGELLLRPRFAWEFALIGNCGAPIELDEGWLLLTHGVGPVRTYSIGAVLLDKADPSKVLARARQPLLGPIAGEREGYVPNVVYTCGAMRNGNLLLLPYGVCDTFTRFATVEIPALLAAMEG